MTLPGASSAPAPVEVPSTTQPSTTPPPLPARSLSPAADLAALRRAATATWRSRRDADAGVSFTLPTLAQPTDRTVDGLPQRLYTSAITVHSGVSVGLLAASSAADVGTCCGVT